MRRRSPIGIGVATSNLSKMDGERKQAAKRDDELSLTKSVSPVILSAAKDLAAQRMRSFAALRMTVPVSVVTFHNRAAMHVCAYFANM
jgi:hypothetical protein